MLFRTDYLQKSFCRISVLMLNLTTGSKPISSNPPPGPSGGAGEEGMMSNSTSSVQKIEEDNMHVRLCRMSHVQSKFQSRNFCGFPVGPGRDHPFLHAN